MRTREAAIYYDYLAEIMDDLQDKISAIREEMLDCNNSYLQDKLRAYLCLTSQLDDLYYEKSNLTSL